MAEVKVCDALCGAGKTMSAINMMNSSGKKFIFITPYLDEAKRIRDGCPDKDFVEPGGKPKYRSSKLKHTNELLKEGRNIASTHALFSRYTSETREHIRNNGYVLVLDEVIDAVGEMMIREKDLKVLKDSGLIKSEGRRLKWLDDDYPDNGVFSDIMCKCKSNNLVEFNGTYVFWMIPSDVFDCFSEVYVLTYMFEYQPLKYIFDLDGIKYKLIGTKNTDHGYEFCDISEMDRRRDLKSIIHVEKNKKLNSVGSMKTALSDSWFKNKIRGGENPELKQLSNNIYNYFRNICKAPSNEVLWTSYKSYEDYLKRGGFAKGYISYNMRASNAHARRKYLAYCTNVFLNPMYKNYFISMGAQVQEDMYGLSTLIQWVFRSAIRNDEEIWIYIPSRRMRGLFLTWLDNLYEGKDLEPIDLKLAPKGILDDFDREEDGSDT